VIHDEALQSETGFINAIGAYAALSLENHRLAAEVSSLVRETRKTQARSDASADHAREEIERDIHDGAQQRLVALRIKLQLAAEHSPATAEQLNQLGAEVQLAIDGVRALAHGVFTPVLDDHGPVAALGETARHAPIQTTVTARSVGRQSPEIERAVYFCCLEALQNAYKHAGTATAARVTIAEYARDLAFEVSDNGVGFDVGTVAGGAGLRNMQDRVAALVGSLAIEATCGHGTRVTGVIPLPTPYREAGN
jgi:signal transduction histidine kinase